MIIETCPKCGGELKHLSLTTYPPIPKKFALPVDGHGQANERKSRRCLLMIGGSQNELLRLASFRSY